MSDTARALLAVGVIAEVLVGAWFLDEPLTRWFVHHGRNRPGRTATLAVASHLVLLAGWWVVLGAHLRWATVPLIAVHGPFLWCFLPSKLTGYRAHHEELRRQGASLATSRAMYWSACPFAIAGLATAMGAFLELTDA